MIVISGGLLIDPSTNTEREADVIIEHDRVTAIEPAMSIKPEAGREIVSAKGMWVVPGLVDLHVHLREPGFEWKETVRTGSRAAILGGYTSICCMPNTNPANDSAEVTNYILDKARQAGAARVLPIGAVSLALEGKQMAPLSELAAAGCVAFSDDGEPVWSSALMRRALEWSKMLNIPISCHEEDKCLSCSGSMNESALSYKLGLRGMPKLAEDVMVARDIEIARAVGAKVHICHVSSGRSVELIRRAKNDGIAITCEVTPHHLTLSELAVAEYDTNAKMSPPLREQYEIEALLNGIKDGTIDAIASDHAPHEKDRKQVEFGKAAFGILGLQTSLPLILKLVRDGTVSKMKAVELMSTLPAKAFGLNAGSLKPGSIADIAIIDPRKRWTFSRELVQSLSFNSPFLGMDMEGAAHTVMVGGRVLLRSGRLENE